MHDLHFLRDALEGGDFCLSLALEALPSKAGLIHLYDIDRREFVIACTNGRSAASLLLKRHPEAEPLLSRAMRKRRAIVLPDATTDGDTAAERFGALGGASSLIVAPVMQSGRFLGVVELINPSDKVPFNEDEGAAVQYIAEQYAEFLSQVGVVVDAERISQRSGQEAAVR
jgi:GAF domain-containing protein